MQSQPEPKIWEFPVELQLLDKGFLWKIKNQEKYTYNYLIKYLSMHLKDFHLKYTIEYTFLNKGYRIPFVQYLLEYPIEYIIV